VPGAGTLTAADYLASGRSDPARAQVLTVDDVQVQDVAPVAQWRDHLALWAQHRGPGSRPLDSCIVALTAPELSPDQLLSRAGFAELTGIAASTLRAYSSRGEGDMPTPQFVSSGRPAWSEPVARDWLEARDRSSTGVRDAVTVDSDEGPRLTVGQRELFDRLTRSFTNRLTAPGLRQRWALRSRSPKAIEEVAGELAGMIVMDLSQIVPVPELASTVRHALLDELAADRDSHSDMKDDLEHPAFYAITRHVGRMLGWMVRFEPTYAVAVIGDTMADARDRLGIPDAVTRYSLEKCLYLDGGLDDEVLDIFLERAMPPSPAA
jgi:hypothetical protein